MASACRWWWRESQCFDRDLSPAISFISGCVEQSPSDQIKDVADTESEKKKIPDLKSSAWTLNSSSIRGVKLQCVVSKATVTDARTPPVFNLQPSAQKLLETHFGPRSAALNRLVRCFCSASWQIKYDKRDNKRRKRRPLRVHITLDTHHKQKGHKNRRWCRRKVAHP